ncbi:hypothetical protein EWM64_g6330 [Hericium alpestre]|uniref:Essential protein Yae1 N-terminal domain-containing protein n=1 Tax=Hericium alpestre TaxID=135208 RepID=A0A4Y9ZSB7_9AGAM|nr:hypothetical protein EWM64_g6330 [Hericium alpestre]
MGKNKCTAKAAWRAAARAAPPLLTTANIGHPLIATVTLIDTPSASAVRESPTTTQQPCISHEADATRASRAASSAQPTIDASLVLEPATAEAQAPMPVAIATPQTHECRTSDSCPEPHAPPPVLTTPIGTSNDVPAISLQQPRVSQHADMLIGLCTPIPVLSASATTAVAVLMAAIDVLGSPTVFLACPIHSFDRAEDFGHKLDVLAPRMCPAMSVEEIDEDLLDNIIEDAQKAVQIEIRCEVRLKALAEGRERGWKEGLDQGKEIARREVRRDARAEMRQQEQGRKDAYELGRWAGYREGLEVARAEVSTTPRIDATVQSDDAVPPHPRSIDTSSTTPHVDAIIQADVSNSLHIPPTDITAASLRVAIGVQAKDPAPSPPILEAPSPRIQVGMQADTPTSPLFPFGDTIHATSHVDTGIQAEDLAPPAVPLPPPAVPLPPPIDIPAPARIDAGIQTDATALIAPSPCVSDHPRTSANARARTVHEIEPDLLGEILAAAIAKGETAGLKKGKQVGFLDGMEVGWKSGMREGREEGYTDGKKDGIYEGHEQYRLEVS